VIEGEHALLVEAALPVCAQYGLALAGGYVHVLRASGRKGHLDVGLPSGAAYRVDVLKEPLNHSPTMMSFVPVLALADAVALKVGALHDRGLIRDVIG
jgi:hypothetical protein